MKSIKKGGEKLKRPMKIRVIALVMAFVMVTSVLVITNRNGKVEAVSEMVSETTYLSGMALKDGDAYSVHVPCDNIKFTLPAIPGQSTVSEDAVVYTNDEENAWSLTATDDLKVEHQVKKSVTTNYEWTGDVASEEGAFTITSSESGSKVATVRKTVTTTYTDNDTVIADLTGSPAVENTDAYTIITDAPAGISIDEVTGVISDADSGKSDSDIVFYYGDSRYSIGDDTTLLTKSEADNKLAGFDDGNYQVTKYIVGEYSSEGKTLWTASSTYSYTKNAVLVEGITISEDGNPQHKTEKAQYEEAVNFSGVNPNNDVIISIKTDDINAKVTVDPAMTVEHAEHNNTFTVPGDITKNDTYETYAAIVKDSLGKVQEINFAIYYGNGTPSISADVITGASEVDGVNYVSGNSDTLEFSATAEATDAQIVDANVEISKNSDMSNPTSTKSANVSDGSISAEITKSDLNEGDNYIRVSAKSDYGITTKSSTILKLVMDSKNPVLSNPVLSQDGSNIADDATITCAKDAEITLDLSDAAPSSGIDKVVVNRAIFEGGDSPVSEAPEISGSKVTLKIPAKTDDSGKSYIYKFKAYDKAGNESAEVTKNVKFDNDASLKITRKVLPSMKNAFAVWEGTKVAVIEYEVTSDVEINENATITIDGEDKSASAEFVKDGFMHYTYTINYSQSKTINNIVFTVKNKNGFSVSDTLEVLHIDVADPQDNGIAGDSKWQKSFFLSGTVSDPQDGDADAVSGLSSAKYSISNSKADVSAKDISISEGKGVVNIEVPESKTTEGTKIKFDLADKANNTYSNTYTYYIDNTPPKADLSISGKDLSSLDDYYLKNDPVIKYSGSDALSGLADTNGIVFRINGTEYKNVSGKKLSDIVGGTSDTTEYNVELVVTDKAGNSTVQKTVFMVDISKPDITVTKSIDGKYTNSNVTVKIQVKESNLKDYVIKRNDKEVNVKLTKKGDEYVGSFVVDKKNYGNNKVTVEVTDASGNTSEGSTSFVIDTKAPKVTTQISKDGNTWYDFNVDEPLDEFLQVYPYVRVKVKDDYEDPDSETVEMTYTPFNDSEGYTDTVTGKKYRLSSSKGNEEGQYEFDFAVKDKAGNKGINVTGDYTEEEAITDLRMCFSVDKTAPKHNLYITTPNPANFDKFNNTYKNVVRKFKDKKDQENYKYGQYYNGRVTIDLSAYDNSLNYDGDVTIMHSYKAPGAAAATLYQEDEHIVYVSDYEWSGGSNVHYKYNTIYVDEPGEHEIWLKSNDHEDPDDGIGGYNTTDDSVHLFFTIDDAAPSVGLFLNNSPYNAGAGNMYSSNVSAYASISDYNLDYIVRNYTINPPLGNSVSSTNENYENATSELFETEADYVIDYTAYDKAGFSSTGTNSMSFRIDKTAPELSISGPGESTTEKSTVTFSMKESFYADMDPGKITIYRRVDGAGESVYETIDFKPSGPSDSISRTFDQDGEYRMEFTATDRTGNTSKADYTFFQDADAPLITLGGVKNYDMTDTDVELGVTVNETFYSTNNVKLTGTRTDIDGQKEDLKFDNFPSNSSVSTLKQLFTLDGIYDINVTSRDKVGNESSEKIHFTIDKTNPLIGDIPIEDGAILKAFNWDVKEDKLIRDLTVCEVNVYIDGVLYDGVSTVEDGSHVLKVEATDEMGNKSSKEITFIIDSIAPNIMISGVEDGQQLEEAPSIRVSVQLDDDTLDSVKLDGKVVKIENNEAVFTVNNKGNHRIEATAVDKAGNESEAKLKFVYGAKLNLLPIFIIAGVIILLLIAAFIIIKRRNANKYSAI